MNTYSKSDEINTLIGEQLPEAFESVARSVGYSLSKEYLSFEIGHEFTILTVPVRRDELPSMKELSEGVDLLFSYVFLPDGERLKSGFYLIRVAIPDYSFMDGTATVSFVNLQGETVHNLQAKKTGFEEEEVKEAMSFDELVSPSNPVFGKICGKTKCFVWKREGFLKWKFGCTNKETGSVVSCVGP